MDFQDGKHHHASRNGCDGWPCLVARMFADAQSIRSKCASAALVIVRREITYQEMDLECLLIRDGIDVCCTRNVLVCDRWQRELVAAGRVFVDLRDFLCEYRHQSTFRKYIDWKADTGAEARIFDVVRDNGGFTVSDHMCLGFAEILVATGFGEFYSDIFVRRDCVCNRGWHFDVSA